MSKEMIEITPVNIIDDIIRLLETDLPANPASDKNSRLADQFQVGLTKYFKKLEGLVSPELLEKFYNKYIKETEPLGDVEDALDAIIKILSSDLAAIIQGSLTEIFLHGDQQTVSWGQTSGGISISYEGPPIKQAISYAKNHSAELVKGINEETRKRLANTIGTAIDQKRGIPGLARDIRNAFEDMTKARSEMIARTETCDALQQAFLQRAEEMGIEGKEWVVTDPCDICQENSDAGVIGLKENFPSGDDAPPAHPNCRCALAPAMLGGK